MVADIREVLATPGQPLDPTVRAPMERRFQWDFGAVRIHGGERAARSAQGLAAEAYTAGTRIVFGAGSPGLSTAAGQRLLTHELAHVVQQGGGPASPRWVGPVAGALEAQAGRVVAGGTVAPGVVPAGTIQRSPLSDRVRAAAGQPATLTSVLAALSGADVAVRDPDLDRAINDLLGGRAEDIALAQQVRSRELGTTAGWAGPRGTGSTKPRSITVRYVAGRTNRRALVIAGVHGTEVQGVEVAEQLIADLSAPGNQPEMSAVIVPDLFPDDAAYRDREGPGAHPNRNFPSPSMGLADAGSPPKDSLGKDIRRENVMLLHLMERFMPERIISIHGTWDPKAAGVSYDTRALTAQEDAAAQARGINPDSSEANAPPGLVRSRRAGLQHAADQRDERLALGAADLIEARASKPAAALPGRAATHASVAGNFKGASTKANYARWGGAKDPGVSLGDYASARGISIFTVEPPDNKKIGEYARGAARSAREVEIKAYAEAVRTILLGS
ncbi:MAG TPA: DUF4157 domain-containing protein [Actinomycetota bacterium]|nr:DUF4157 domain-containing protein [Actinomycetota bacterium]